MIEPNVVVCQNVVPKHCQSWN